MQVSHQTDHVTHAVIGGQQSIEFGISTSAEFFNILSSTLYKDQELAVVREVLCNAWDAHIEAGCTDRPVQVTLTNEQFTIKDFGRGIHQDDMGLIYGTYGNSTKKNDGEQTGGFGLGCKAPFAYTDHFEVTSAHEGIRTIYTLAKSSAQAQGRPGITPIASFPCTDSGLTVNIRIKPIDYRRFKELIERIAYNGDMNVTLNGERLPTLEFDVSKGNFLLVRTPLLDNHSRIMVRYGNVVYPAEASGNEVAYKAIVGHLDTLREEYGATPYSIVFQAPPHSIAVTPSRESLSMQEHTIGTLKKLFDGFLASLDREFKAACDKRAKALIDQAVAHKRIDELLKQDEELPVLGKAVKHAKIADFDTMAQTYLQRNYPQGLAYRKQDITQRLNAMAQAKLLDRGQVQTFLRALERVRKPVKDARSWGVQYEANTWLQRRVLAPLLRRLDQTGLPTKQLYVCCAQDLGWERSYRAGIPPLVPATQSKPHHLLATLPYLRNLVVLATRRAELTERAYRHEVFQAAGQYEGFLVYIVGRRKGELEAVRQFFAQTGMRVADLTVQEEEDIPVRIKASTPRKPVNKGVVSLKSILRANGIKTPLCQRDDAPRIDNPEFMVQVSFRSGIDTSSLGQWSHMESLHLVRLFGDKGGITNSTATFDKWREKGTVAFEDYVREKICAHILDNPQIAAHWAYRSEAVMIKANRQRPLLQLILANDALSQAFGMGTPLSEEDRMYLLLWQGLIRQTSRYNTPPEVAKVRDWLAAIPTAAAAEDLLKKLESPLLPLLDVNQLRWMLVSGETHDLPGIVALLKTILK